MLIDGFQALLNDQFEVAPDVFTIQEESTFGSNQYSDIVARVNRGIQQNTGLKLGDDFKNLLFKDLTYAPTLGKKYKFDNNVWIVVFSETIKNLAVSALVTCLMALETLPSNIQLITE